MWCTLLAAKLVQISWMVCFLEGRYRIVTGSMSMPGLEGQPLRDILYRNDVQEIVWGMSRRPKLVLHEIPKAFLRTPLSTHQIDLPNTEAVFAQKLAMRQRFEMCATWQSVNRKLT